MTKNQNEKAFKDAEKEIYQEKVDKIKDVMKRILQRIQEAKEKKTQAEEELRILKLDMEDLRAGRINKIEERQEKSAKAKKISPINLSDFTFVGYTSIDNPTLHHPFGDSTLTVADGITSINWNEATAGTYSVNCSNGEIKEMYIGQ